MLINVVNVNRDANGDIASVIVTDGNETRIVAPYLIFNALLQGTMQSNTARLNIYGLDIIVDGQLVAIELEMTREQSKIIKDMLNIKTEKAPTVREKQLTPRQKEQLSKEQKLEQERIDFRIKQQEQMEENRARAALAREQGLVNLSPEERLRRRQEYFRNKRNEQ